MTYDRAAIMRDAWKRHRDGQRLALGWTFAQCLRTAWAAARLRRAFPAQRYGDAPVSRITGRRLMGETIDRAGLL